MPRFLIGVGSNLGDRSKILDKAIERLSGTVDALTQSSLFTYPAIGGASPQPDFLNGVLLADAELGALEFAQYLHTLEVAAGRKHGERWASRPLDLDLLLVDSQEIHTESLIVPHPRMMARRFVLEPAAEVAADWIHPTAKWTIQQLLDNLSSPPWYAVTGTDLTFCQQLADAMRRASEGVVMCLSASDVCDSSVESAPQTRRRLSDAMAAASFPEKPLISFSRGLEDFVSLASHRPKLILVAEAMDSEFSRRLRSTVAYRAPMVYLSKNRAHAVQDAVAVVLGMN